MHPRIAELVAYLDAETEKLSRLYESVPAERRPRDTDPSRVLDDLMDARRELTAAIAAADGLALGRVSAPHPALGQFNGYDWIAFAGTHVARHAAQIREGL